MMYSRNMTGFVSSVLLSVLLLGCAQVSVPDARNVSIPPPVTADERKQAVNERPDSVMYLPLGDDVLVPEVLQSDPLPSDIVGPFELRAETLAGALQLIMAEYDISLSFETDAGLSRQVTVANLRGPLGKIVSHVCSLADLYCLYQDGILTIKDTQTFTVTLPPIGGEDEEEFLDDVIEGLTAIVGEDVDEPIADPTTRTIIYTATQRTSELASRYFQRLRANTALIVFETYIWEVSLEAGNSTGINWDAIDTFGKFEGSFSISGDVAADFLNPVNIGLPTTGVLNEAAPTEFIRLLSQFGAVKTISQPQITVLSGSSAELRVADTENFVSEISTTFNDNQSTTSVSTDSVDTGFTLTIGSNWDKATVYADIALELTNVISIDNFTFSDGGDDAASTTIQLPQTSERQLDTQVRVRPGDSILIAGLVRENDNFDSDGPGFMEPVIPQSRTAQTENLELVILLRPRVVVFTGTDDDRYIDYVYEKQRDRSASVVSGLNSADEARVQKNIKPLSSSVEKSVSKTLPEISKSLYQVEEVQPIRSPQVKDQPVSSGRNIYEAPKTVRVEELETKPAFTDETIALPPPITSEPVSLSPPNVEVVEEEIQTTPVSSGLNLPPIQPQNNLRPSIASDRYGAGYVSKPVNVDPDQRDIGGSSVPRISKPDPAIRSIVQENETKIEEQIPAVETTPFEPAIETPQRELSPYEQYYGTSEAPPISPNQTYDYY